MVVMDALAFRTGLFFSGSGLAKRTSALSGYVSRAEENGMAGPGQKGAQRRRASPPAGQLKP